ncbi:MAG: AAA family ATPase [Eggerthellaceae bacterium]|nr:AAA family ATPase [Eggerthellaceae bacterium]
MKKRSVLNLIKYHVENNNYAFKTEAIEIAKEFDEAGDFQLAEYIMALVSDTNAFVPQSSVEDSCFLQKVSYSEKPLPLPLVISDDIKGIINAIGHNVGVNKFLLQGPPGTGKTESAKHIARILERDLYSVDFSAVIDSKLGQTGKNITALFREINGFPNPDKIVVLFDELDALALDRTNGHDVREMGRATSAFLRELENMSSQLILIATTNLFENFDKAMIRRFDSVIDFSRYSREDLLEIAEIILNSYLDQFKFAGRDTRLFNKIMKQMEDIPYPADLANIIKTSIAFSNPDQEHDYLQRLYKAVVNSEIPNVEQLRAEGYTLREIGILTGVPKSTLSRELRG